jgi:hypothetical protein
VIVLVTEPFCPRCLDVATSFELLGRAAQAETRVVIAKINRLFNDLPPTLQTVSLGGVWLVGTLGGRQGRALGR